MKKTKKKPKIFISWWLVIFQAILVRYVKINSEWIKKVRKASKHGPVVFVLRNRSLINFLCLRGLCKKYNLADIGFVSGLSPFVFLPLWRWLLSLLKKQTFENQQKLLLKNFKAGGSSVVFLRQPSLLKTIGSEAVKIDGIKLTIEAQSHFAKEVIVLPSVILWGEHPMRLARSGLDFMFGTSEYPRLLRSVWLLLSRRSIHGTWIQSPIKIAKIREERGVSNETLTGIVRTGIWRSIQKIRRHRLGSLTKPSVRIKSEVLNSRKLQAKLTTIANENGISENETKLKTRSIINNLATDFKPSVLAFLAVIIAFIWNRIYSGFELDEKDIENIRKATSQGPLLLLPCHKSHVDYLAMSQTMATANIMLPHIAAGENLAFWPIGWLFRSSGAFFIRRKFVNDKFYAEVVNAYIRRLIHEEYIVEVFIEGGRSRTGKLLRPKTGMIEMSLRAMASISNNTLGVLPIFIGYEQIIEENSYVRESEGKSKKTESVSGLLKTSNVLFRKYGRLQIRTGKYFSVQNILDDLNIKRQELEHAKIRRMVALEIGLQTLHEINRVTVVTSASILSTALLIQKEKKFSQQIIEQDAIWLLDFLRAKNVNQAKMIQHWSTEMLQSKSHSLESGITAFVKSGKIIVDKKSQDFSLIIKDGQRRNLDYYKNNIIHFFVPSSIIAVTFLNQVHNLNKDNKGIALEDIHKDFALACSIYRWDFLLPEYKKMDNNYIEKSSTIINETLALMLKTNLIKQENNYYYIVNEQRINTLVEILRNYHEVYYCALYVTKQKVTKQKVTKQKVSKKAAPDINKTARSFYDDQIATGFLIKSEGKNLINFKNAFQALKDLKLNRPSKDEYPFDKNEFGSNLLDFLSRALGKKNN